MSLHPLSPRKPLLHATVAGCLTGAFLTLVSFLFLNAAFPLIAWVPALDRPLVADLQFLSKVFASLFYPGSGQGPLGLAVMFVELPAQTIALAKEFDIALPLSVRILSAIILGSWAAAFVRGAILDAALAEPAVEHVKGPKLLSGKVAAGSLQRAWTRRFGKVRDGVYLAPDVQMPRALEAEHILITGGTGAGKTTILETILDSALKRGDRILVLDVKGDLKARLPCADMAVLSLSDADAARWDIGRDILTRSDALELAIELIPQTSDPSWSSGARRVLAALVGLLQKKSASQGKVWNWRHLDTLLQKPVSDLHRLLQADYPAEASFIDVSNDATLKQAMSFYLVLITCAGLVVNACASSTSGRQVHGLSIREWAEGRSAQALILHQSARQPELSSTIARLVLKIVADTVVARPLLQGSDPVWLALDELPQLGRCAAVTRLAAIGRSAGVRLVAIVQSPAQLRETYGIEGAQGLIDNFATKIVSRVSSGKTAIEISSTWIGERTVRWSEEVASDARGTVRHEARMKDIPVVDPALLSDKLGLSCSPTGSMRVHALVIGHGNVARLAWPVGRWVNGASERKMYRSAGKQGVATPVS